MAVCWTFACMRINYYHWGLQNRLLLLPMHTCNRRWKQICRALPHTLKRSKAKPTDRQTALLFEIGWFCCRWSCEVSFDLFQTTCGRAASMFAIWLTGTSAVLSSSKPTRRTTNAILRCRIWQRLCRIFCPRCRKKVASTSYLPESTIIHPDSGVSLEGPKPVTSKTSNLF